MDVWSTSENRGPASSSSAGGSPRLLKSALLVAVLLLCAAAFSASAAEVFLVSSYHEGDMCGRPQCEAALEALKQSGIPDLSFRVYHLDSRRRAGQEVDGDIEKIIADIRERKPALVLTVDDLAFSRLYGEVVRRPSTFLVFTGLNRAIAEYDREIPFLDEKGLPVKNITGVFEYLFMKEQFEMLEVLLRRPLKKVALLHSTDPVGIIVKEQIAGELEGTPYAEMLEFHAAEDAESVLRLAEALGADETLDAWIPVTMSVKNAHGGFLTMGDLAKEMTSRIRKPDLALNVSFTELGFYGGVSVDFYQMGFQTGLMAAKLLKGHSIREIPVENARTSIIAVNRSRLRELGISISGDFAAIVDIFLE